MKYIFDFDDVLFNNTTQFKEHIYTCLEKAGVSRNTAEEYYKKERVNPLHLKKILAHFSVREDLYEEIMVNSKNFSNEELFKIIRKIGKDNCYIITYGNKEFNLDKITRSGAGDLFHKRNVFIVSGSKKDIIEKICDKHKDEEVIFIDDKAYHFKDLDFKKYPNLRTILYTGQNLKPYLPRS